MISRPLTPHHADPALDSEALALLQSAPFVVTYHPDETELAWTHAGLAERVFHAAPGGAPQSLDELLSRMVGDGARERAKAIKALTWDGASYQLDYQITARDGKTVWIEERGQRIAGDGPNPARIIGVLTHIENRRASEQEAAYRLVRDDLTGVSTRARLQDELDAWVAGVQRGLFDFTYYAVRISNLPNINATYGFEAGEQVLKLLAKRLEQSVLAPDLLARVGGISFGIAKLRTSKGDIETGAAQLRALMTETPLSTPHGQISVQCAIGASVGTLNSKSGFDILAQGRTALSHSMTQDGEFAVYAPAMTAAPPRSVRRGYHSEDIISALNDRRITLAYQPIVHARTREAHHYESLLRLTREDGEVVSAGEFIMAAEKLGHVDLLDRRALEIAAETLRSIPDITLALNVSAATVKSEGSSSGYITALRALGPLTNRMIIELTETVALEDPALASRFSMQARALGCKFAIDDFGAGYTSFQNLMAIEADEIKIDGSFIRDLSSVPHKQVFVRMMVDLAQTFSVKTVAEMVDSRDDAELLTRLGVDYLQGFMFGIPGPIPEKTAKLQDRPAHLG